jgi:hypothetical protein
VDPLAAPNRLRNRARRRGWVCTSTDAAHALLTLQLHTGADWWDRLGGLLARAGLPSPRGQLIAETQEQLAEAAAVRDASYAEMRGLLPAGIAGLLRFRELTASLLVSEVELRDALQGLRQLGAPATADPPGGKPPLEEMLALLDRFLGWAREDLVVPELWWLGLLCSFSGDWRDLPVIDPGLWGQVEAGMARCAWPAGPPALDHLMAVLAWVASAPPGHPEPPGFRPLVEQVALPHHWLAEWESDPGALVWRGWARTAAAWRSRAARADLAFGRFPELFAYARALAAIAEAGVHLGWRAPSFPGPLNGGALVGGCAARLMAETDDMWRLLLELSE